MNIPAWLGNHQKPCIERVSVWISVEHIPHCPSDHSYHVHLWTLVHGHRHRVFQVQSSIETKTSDRNSPSDRDLNVLERTIQLDRRRSWHSPDGTEEESVVNDVRVAEYGTWCSTDWCYLSLESLRVLEDDSPLRSVGDFVDDRGRSEEHPSMDGDDEGNEFHEDWPVVLQPASLLKKPISSLNDWFDLLTHSRLHLGAWLAGNAWAGRLT